MIWDCLSRIAQSPPSQSSGAVVSVRCADSIFSIFALIFGKGMGSTQTPKIKAVVIDLVQTAESQQAVERDS
jgi:hypothetical protein